MAFMTGALIAGGLGLAGSAIASNNSKKATASAVKASNDATAANNALQLGVHNDNKATLAPWVQQGAQANPQVNALLASNPYSYEMGDFQESPGYQFAFDEAMRGVNGQYADQWNSGGRLKALQNRAAGLASQEHGNWFNQQQAQIAGKNNVQSGYLNALTGQQQLGMGAASATAGVGQNFANNVSNNNFQAAQVQGNAALANAGAQNALIGNVVGAGANLLGQYGGNAGPRPPMAGTSYAPPQAGFDPLRGMYGYGY